jgi:hypothetical protein
VTNCRMREGDLMWGRGEELLLGERGTCCGSEVRFYWVRGEILCLTRGGITVGERGTVR